MELIFKKMDVTKIRPDVTSPHAGDDGEAMAASAGKPLRKPNEGLVPPADAGWYVAVVRVNCETRIAASIQLNLNHKGLWFDYWVPKTKYVSIDKRTLRRKVKEKLFLSTFIFCHLSQRHLNDVRFRSDVYKMLTMPGHRAIYRIPDKEIADYRNLVENDTTPVSAAPVPLKKGIRVRIMAGSMQGMEAYVQRFTGKKAVIGNEIRYVSGATIEVDRDLLEVIGEG